MTGLFLQQRSPLVQECTPPQEERDGLRLRSRPRRRRSVDFHLDNPAVAHIGTDRRLPRERKRKADTSGRSSSPKYVSEHDKVLSRNMASRPILVSQENTSTRVLRSQAQQAEGRKQIDQVQGKLRQKPQRNRAGSEPLVAKHHCSFTDNTVTDVYGGSATSRERLTEPKALKTESLRKSRITEEERSNIIPTSNETRDRSNHQISKAAYVKELAPIKDSKEVSAQGSSTGTETTRNQGSRDSRKVRDAPIQGRVKDMEEEVSGTQQMLDDQVINETRSCNPLTFLAWNRAPLLAKICQETFAAIY